MKKFLLLTLSISMFSFAQSNKIAEKAKLETEKFKKEVSATSKNVEETKNSLKSQATTLRQDVKEGISTLHSDVTEATKYITPKAEKLLKSVFNTVGNTTVKLWEIIVKQQKVMSWCYLSLFILAGISFISMSRRIKLIKETIKQKDDESISESTRMSLMGFNSIMLICSVIVFALSSYHAVPNLGKMMTGFINPEFGAIEQIYEQYQIQSNKSSNVDFE